MVSPSLAKKVLSFWPVWALLVLTIFMFWQAVFPPVESWVLSREAGDVSTLYYYWRHFGFSELKKGIIPLWNPYVFCGVPFSAYPESALFYPPNVIFLFLPLARALSWSFILHVFLIALFQFLYLKYLGLKNWSSFLGALILMLSAPVILHLSAGHLSNICTMAWVPLLFLLGEGFMRSRRLRWAVGLGFFLGFQILAGHWQYVYYSLIWLALYVLIRFLIDFKTWKRQWLLWLGGIILCLLIATGLAAVQILPALEVSQDSFRKELGYQWSANFSLPPINLVAFFLPSFLGDTIRSFYWGRFYFWEMCGYVGFIPLLLALGAVMLRRDKLSLLFAGLTLGAVVIALGAYTPLFKFLYDFVPGFRYFRGSSKQLFFVAFFLSVMAARGIEPVEHWLRAGRKGMVALGSGLLLILALTALLFPGTGEKPPPDWWRSLLKTELCHGPHYDIIPPGEPAWWKELVKTTPPSKNYPLYLLYVQRLVEETPFARESWATFLSGLRRLGWFLLGLSLLFMGMAFPRSRYFPISGVLILLAAVELFSWAMPYIVGFDSQTCLWEKGMESFFHAQTEPFRYLSADEADYNRGMLSHISSIVGYQADLPRRYLDYFSASEGKPLDSLELLPDVKSPSRLLDLLNVRFFIALLGVDGDPLGFRKEVWPNQNALPRVLISPRVKVISEREQILRELNDHDYHPEKFLVLEEEISPPFDADGRARGTACLKNYASGSALVKAELSSPGFLLFNDAYSPGWKAYVDGEETKIYRANYLMRAICLEEGKHSIRFVYRPLSFAVGVVISLSALFILIIVAAFAMRRRFAK